MKVPVSTAKAPAAIGPYSQAVVATGGRIVFLSGQIPIDPVTGELIQGDIEAQARRVLDNMAAVLEAAGLGFEHVVRTTLYLAELADFQRVNAVYGAVFGDAPPARTAIQVAGLPKGARVEIDAIAVG